MARGGPKAKALRKTIWGLFRRPLRLSLTIVFGVSSGVPSASFVLFPEGLAFDPTPDNPHAHQTNSSELK